MSRDLLPPSASALIGGPLGRRASAASQSVRALLPLIVAMTVVPLSVAVLRQGHCLQKGWNGNDQFWRGCFTDLTAQYSLGGLDAGLGGWWSGPVVYEHLPLLSAALSFVGGLVPDAGPLDQTRWYFALWTVIIAALAMTMVWLVGMLHPDRLDLATQMALTPAWVVAGLLSADVLVVALVLGAFLAWRRGRLGLVGVLLGLGMLAHAWVVVAAIALALSASRRGTAPAAMRALGIAAVTAAGGYALAFVARDTLVTGPVRGWWDAGAGYGSPLFIPQAAGYPLPAWVVTAASVVGAVAAVVIGVRFARMSWAAPTWPQVAAVVVPIMVMTGKAVPVQAGLWVLPLAIAAGISWRAHLLFVAVEALHAMALWLHIPAADAPARGLPGAWYAVMLVIRTGTWALLLWSLWYVPNRNTVRGPGAAARSEDVSASGWVEAPRSAPDGAVGGADVHPPGV